MNQANLGLTRDMLMKGFNDSLIQAYYHYMVNVSVIFGANRSRAEEDFRKVVDFEIELANVSSKHFLMSNFNA